MREALAQGKPLPVHPLPRPGLSKLLRTRRVPVPTPRPEFLAHPRLRRTSPISHYATSAALEALGNEVMAVKNGSIRLGIILCVMAGCVSYSRRFYDEASRAPAAASPLLFSETVFNAPASHLASLLGSTAIAYTLVGDPGMFLIGLALGAQWLREDKIDGCVVVGAEELDWLIADAARRFQRNSIVSEGAGAIYLKSTSDSRLGIELQSITDAHNYVHGRSRESCLAQMRGQLPADDKRVLLCDSQQGILRADAVEAKTWANWPGVRLSPKVILGDGLASSSAWQCVAATDYLMQSELSGAVISVVGCNQQTIGAYIARSGLPCD